MQFYASMSRNIAVLLKECGRQPTEANIYRAHISRLFIFIFIDIYEAIKCSIHDQLIQKSFQIHQKKILFFFSFSSKIFAIIGY